MESWDVVIVGSGPAALRAAIASSDAGANPLIIDSLGVGAGQGSAPSAGFAASITEVDSTAHRDDTISAGGDSVDKTVASRICGEAVGALAELERWGLVLRRSSSGLPQTTPAPGHSQPRLTGCGDSTNSSVTKILEEQVIKRNITRRSDILPLSLVLDNQQIRGLTILQIGDGEVFGIQTKSVILATEGYQGLWSNIANGSGLGNCLAIGAGISLRGMEHFANHSMTVSGTDLHIPIELISSGGIICKVTGENADLTTVISGESCILDMRNLTTNAKIWFSQTIRRLESRTGLNVETDVIPISAGISATTGGSPVDENGRVTFDEGSMWYTGLYAAGRSANTGLHGGSILPGNILLEDIISGSAAGTHAGAWASTAQFGGFNPLTTELSAAEDKISNLFKNSGISVFEFSSKLSSIVTNINGNAQKTLSELSNLKAVDVQLTDNSRIMNTELVAALKLEGLISLAESIVDSK